MRRCGRKTIIVRNEFDYKKIQGIIRNEIKEYLANERDRIPEASLRLDNLQEVIVNSIIEATESNKERTKKDAEDKQKERLKNLQDKLDVSHLFDEKGNLKSKKAQLVLIKKFIIAKEHQLRNIYVLNSAINGILAFIFAVLEWGLYLLSFALLCIGLLKLFNIDFLSFDFPFKNLVYSLTTAICFTYSVTTFLVSRVIIRLIKIECKYNDDKNYMMNFLAVLVSVVALLVSLFLKGGC